MTLIIRRYELDDAAAMHEAARESVETLRPWMPWCTPEYSIDDARQWCEQQHAMYNDRVQFELVIASPDGRFLGGIGLNQFDHNYRRANLGYWVRASAAGRGVATAAAKQTIAWGFANTDLIRIEIVVAVDNIASQRVAEKVGAVREGVARKRLLLHGRSHDAVIYSCVREE